jgi:hypothetical protein
LKDKAKKSQEDFREAKRAREIADAELNHLKRLGRVDLEARRAAELARERSPAGPMKDPRLLEMKAARGFTRVEPWSPGFHLVEQMASVGHAHVPIAAYVTSYARVQLYRQMTETDGRTFTGLTVPGWQATQKIYYCDTDGFATSDASRKTSNELGDIKLDKEFDDSLFDAPKVYWLQLRRPKKNADGLRIRDIVKAKGFSRLCDCLEPLPNRKDEACPRCGFTRKSKTLTRTGFARLVAQQPAYSQRMQRIRETWRLGETHPTEAIIEKRITREALPKRKFAADGTSEPWEYERLIEIKEHGSDRTDDEISDEDFMEAGWAAWDRS